MVGYFAAMKHNGVFMKTNLLTIALVLSVVATTNVKAKIIDGGSDRGGGDSRVIRSKIMQNKRASLIVKTQDLFSNKGNIDIRNVLAWFNSSKVALGDKAADAILNDMRSRGFAKNLFETPFVMKDKCIDKEGVSKTATTSINKMGSEICINTEKLVDDFGPYIQDSDIIALLMHEYSHHFGYEDMDHSFAAAIADAYQKDSENRNEEGDPLNFLIK